MTAGYPERPDFTLLSPTAARFAQQLTAQFKHRAFGHADDQSAQSLTISPTASAETARGSHQVPAKALAKAPTHSYLSNEPEKPSGISFGEIAAHSIKEWKKSKKKNRKARANTKLETEEKIEQPAPPLFADLFPDARLQKRKWQFLEVLHRLGVKVYQDKGYNVLPSQMTIFCSNELLAAAFGVNPATIWRWIKEFTEAGLLMAKPHHTHSRTVRSQADFRKAELKKQRAQAQAQAQHPQSGQISGAVETSSGAQAQAAKGQQKKGGKKKPLSKTKDTVVDGMVYSIRFRPGHQPYVHLEDLQHQYRDLDADRKSGRTAWKICKIIKAQQAQADQASDQPQTKDLRKKKMQGSYPPMREETYSILEAWATAKKDEISISSIDNDPCISDKPPLTERLDVQGIIHAIGLIRDAHPTRRAAVVEYLADNLCHVYGDKPYKLAYCKLIWEAWIDEREGRNGLQWLSDSLARVHAAMQDKEVHIRKPGAFLTWVTRQGTEAA